MWTKAADVWAGELVGKGANEWAGAHCIHLCVVFVRSFMCWGSRMGMLVGVVPLVYSGCIVRESQECRAHFQRIDVHLRVEFTCDVA